MISLMIILTVILSSSFSAFGFEFKRRLTSQFSTSHLPLAEENDWIAKNDSLSLLICKWT